MTCVELVMLILYDCAIASLPLDDWVLPSSFAEFLAAASGGAEVEQRENHGMECY